MNINNFGDREESFTVVVNVPGATLHSALLQSNDLTEFSNLPTWNGNEVIHPKKVSKYNPSRVITQYLYQSLGEPDKQSQIQQFGGESKKNAEGKKYLKLPKNITVQDYICAAVLSKIHDSIVSLEGISFTYNSNDLNFKAQWSYGKNKFIIVDSTNQ